MTRLDELFAGLPTHLTVDQLGEVLGVSRQTAYNWLNKGVVPGYKLGNTWVIVRDEIRDHLVAHRNQPVPETPSESTTDDPPPVG